MVAPYGRDSEDAANPLQTLVTSGIMATRVFNPDVETEEVVDTSSPW